MGFSPWQSQQPLDYSFSLLTSHFSLLTSHNLVQCYPHAACGQLSARQGLPLMDRIRSRRLFIRAALIAPAALAIGQTVRAAESPSSGCGRPGPACAVTTPPRQSRGPKPMAIMIPDAEVDAPIEVCEIVDGVMSAPSGPWVVGWYRESGHLG